MGKVEPMLPDDELDGLLREAVERVRRDPVSDQLIERCASRAMEIPLSSAVRATHTDLDRRATTATSQLWSWREAFALAASLLVVLSVNALSFALDRPDPDRQNTSTSVRGINDLGQVVGASNSAAVTWQNGSIQLLPVQAGLVSVAQGINDAGQIVGGAGDGVRSPCSGRRRQYPD